MASKDRGLTLEEIQEETKKLVAHLCICAEQPVTIRLEGGQAIAYTHSADDTKKKHVIPIVMNPNSIAGIRNKERAKKIWWGLGFHELSHHLFPAEAQYKQAYKEGFGQLFNLVDDEHIERNGRSRFPEWGECFQSMMPIAWPKRRNKKDQQKADVFGTNPWVKPQGHTANAIYIERSNSFGYHFRRHVEQPESPLIQEALALIPENFKDLSKAELFELTRQIHEILCRGIDKPKPPEQTPEEKAEEEKAKKEAEEKQKKKKKPGQKDKPGEIDNPDQQDDEDGEDGDGDQDKDDKKDKDGKKSRSGPTWNVKKMLTSKWLLIPLALFVLGWGVTLAQAGVSFWLQMAIYTGIGVAFMVLFAILRWRTVKAMWARVNAKTGPPGEKKTSKVKLAFIGFCYLVMAGVIFMLLAKLVGIPWAIAIYSGAAIVFAGVIGRKAANQAKKTKKPMSKAQKAGVLAINFAALAVLGALFYLFVPWEKFSLWMLVPAALFTVAFTTWIIFGLMHSNRTAADGTEVDYFEETGGVIWKVIGPPMRLAGRGLLWFFGILGESLAFLWKYISKVLVFLFTKTKIMLMQTWWFVQPLLKRLWEHTAFRLAVIALPIAAIGLMLYAVLYTAAQVNIWLLVGLIVAILLLLLLLFMYRKQIAKFIINEVFMPMPSLMGEFMQVPLDMTTDWFLHVNNIQPTDADVNSLAERMPEIRALGQLLRPLFANCGRGGVDKEGEPEGFDLIDEVELALMGESSVFVNDDQIPRASVDIQVALDCSGSMASATKSLGPGEKFVLGKIFAMVIEHAVTNLPGVSAHFWGFNDKTIFDCGVAGEGRISGLTISGGNNDSAMLWHMAQHSARSGKDIKLLLMLSDGQPSECSWLSLKNLVLRFEQEGMVPWNFGLDHISVSAFERYFTDLVGQSMSEAVLTMGQTLAQITAERSE